jgi:hypothetical protein
MNIHEATDKYESWLTDQLAGRGGLDTVALGLKHDEMRTGKAFSFLRATFYRWAQLWLNLERGGPVIACVGDTHVENFGTWRDSQDRLVWGVNDFDEACALPWTSDLVRLGVSARFAIAELDAFDLKPDEALNEIHSGYRTAFIGGSAAPLALENAPPSLRDLVDRMIRKKSPEEFYKKRIKKTDETADVPPLAEALLLDSLNGAPLSMPLRRPEANDPPGMGSRGKRRFYALAEGDKQFLVREVKPAIASATEWASGGSGRFPDTQLLTSKRRFPDPTQRVRDGWIVRRLGNDADKIELGDLQSGDAKMEEERILFRSMGSELANLHLTSANAPAVTTDLETRDPKGDWFLTEVAHWAGVIGKDFADYQHPAPV